jgi:hypothetical protein
MDNESLILGLVILAVIAVLFVLFRRRSQSKHLRHHFGPEYERTVEATGSRDKAEAELLARRKRVDKLNIVPLSPADAQRYTQAWRALQARFVDDPHSALDEADVLVRDLMSRRGYPMGDFERSAADISVHHPGVVEHYRAGHAIAQQHARGEVDTEGMRQAVIHYRALFSELLEVDGNEHHDPHPPGMRTQS